MDAYTQMTDGIKWVLSNRTSYQVAKDLGINSRTVNRYQNGETPLENMTLATAEKLYNYYLEEMKVSKLKGNIKITGFKVEYDEEFQLWYVMRTEGEETSRAFETEEEATEHLDKVLWGAPLY